MDPLAHTLLGAALAKTRLGGDTRLALPTLVLAANVPDLDVAAYFWGSDAALDFRRGLTHGPLGLALLPALVAVTVWLVGRRRGAQSADAHDASGAPPTYDEAGPAAPDSSDWAHRRSPHPGPAHREAAHREPTRLATARERPASTPARSTALAPLLALAYLGALTHPVLDWLNTYGVRLLHPFDERWFYGDALFIIDPWAWLVLGAAVFLAHHADRRSVGAWAILAAVAGALLITAADSTAAKLLWIAALVTIAAVKMAGRPRTETGRRRAATACVLAFTIYVVAMIGGSLLAKGVVHGSIEPPVEALMVGPLPVTVARRQVVVSMPDEIRHGRFRWHPSPRLEWSGWSRPHPRPGPVLDAALHEPSIQGFLAWARFLFVEIDEHPDRFEVHLMDARYTLQRNARFGTAVVEVPKP
ncbi:MAG TPA: metal-dependent hydrolase [Thermoanaerobaculia bacterium]|nr:metal-dependent hydrolase [Thermoanaerobaculia bacterium]